MDNVLNEFINGIQITEEELELRLGYGRSILRPLHDHLVDKHRSAWPDEASDPSVGPSEIPVEMSRAQMGTMSSALRDLATGADIEAWEFPVRLGQEPTEALRLAGELDDAIESLLAQ